MTRSFIVAAHRSAVAPRGGALAHLDIHDLAAPVVQACLKTAGIAAQDVDELIAGNALGAGGNPARLVALASGLPASVAGLSIDRQCCSGLDAINLADALIKSGRAQVVIAGGVESYSRRPLRSRTFADGRPAEPYDRPPFAPWPDQDPDLAEAADMLGIPRAAQDSWAIESHQKAARQTASDEITPIAGLAQDAFTRNLTPKLCARAAPISGDITSANTSVAADAAAFCVVVSAQVADRLTAPALEIIHGVTVGDRPDCPGIAPVAAIKKLLAETGLTPNTLSVAEVMEAYAAQAIACVTQAGLDPDIVNPGGGSLARGHPIGASGAINAVRLFHELKTRRGYGLATIAAAGGLGTALLLRACH
ncbi:thiolase family protein [Actibacterium lipolyticum]|uniref:Putative acetyl-CoA C-acetyltransferase YhfS n=1 Tax=Actibacterium lipolyticum TaxID=1524263 RepID=A0A238KIB7_9RHOB|nr:thiolase family protein [Actibacterium lipolyticum]SMX42417.1 Putative acetyl-CoA C-acetyltransferase YhfS [Actibacterium lipolyticum]